jgi:hypothetical protein
MEARVVAAEYMRSTFGAEIGYDCLGGVTERHNMRPVVLSLLKHDGFRILAGRNVSA